MIHPITNNIRPRPIPYKSGYVDHQHTPIWTVTNDCYRYDRLQDWIQISSMMSDIVNSIEEQYHLNTDEKQKCTLAIYNVHTNVGMKCEMPLGYVSINVAEFCFDTLWRRGTDNKPRLRIWFDSDIKCVNIEMNLEKDPPAFRTIKSETGEPGFELGQVTSEPADWLKKHGFLDD